MVFEFSSGAPNHPEGFGAWTVRWNEEQLLIEHRVRDKVTRYPAVVLSKDGSAGLRTLIEQAGLEKSQKELAPAAPGRVPALFRIRRGDREATTRETTTKVWVDWDRKGDPVTRLVLRLAELIEQHTGIKPVLAS